ncbi:MAG: spondin domain-containing protein [Mangrovicoccus sp.]|nr:spondin domain-containing protein [Mangrovicoccus sp.]
MTHSRFAGLAALALMAGVSASAASAASQLEFTVENLTSSGSFSFTPLYLGFHDGSFDAFDVGQAASPGVELLAELGVPGPGSQPGTVAAERLAVVPGSQGAVIAAPGNGVPTVDPGESVSQVIDIADPASNQYLTFLSMLVPSNDTFFGNDDPLAYQLFDSAGNFTGPFSIDVTAQIFYDAGTELNSATNGPAFVVDTGNPVFPGAPDATAGGVENGVITKASNPVLGFETVSTPVGALDSGLIRFADDPVNFSFARISVQEVTAPVPLPAGVWLGLSAFGALGGLRVLGRRAA